MEFDLPVGTTRTENYTVEEKHIADFLGSGKVAVLSTPSMILMMEHTAMLHAQEFLPEGWITVGTRVDIRHLKSSRIGSTIVVNVTLKEVDGKRLVYEVEAFDGEDKIGDGNHERFIVNKEKFMSRI
ncbi:MAG: thioesterase family protein [Candidatus Thorarchaeota archaeon]